MSYFQRNKKQIIIIASLAVLLLAALIYWLQKRYFRSSDDIEAKVYPTTLQVGDTLRYQDKTGFAVSRLWNFGDGNVSVMDSGIYIFSRPGYYQVNITVNEKYSKNFTIQVAERPGTTVIEDTVVATIEGPIQAMQYENVVFRTNVTDASSYNWSFGESGAVDARERMAIYSYQKPGNYVVTFYTDKTQYPITKQIKILPSYKEVSDSVSSVDDIYKRVDDDFKYNLQQIANGNDFNGHYNYLLKKYLCGNENAVIKVNDSKANNFYYYCTGLQFDKNVTIQSVKVGLDDNLSCVTKVDIIQSK